MRSGRPTPRCRAKVVRQNPKRKETTMTAKPSFNVYTVKSRSKGQKAIWTKIGAAWPHSSGTGFSIELDAFPVDGRLVLIEPKAIEEGATAEAGAAQ
jgi:hypothetical protein